MKILIDLLFAAICLVVIFFIHVSKTEKKYKGKKMSFSQKLAVYFHICPCGGRIEKWSSKRYDCMDCGERFYI